MASFTNPIVSGFHPDPSALRVGEDYYLATSTFEWFPGVEIRHSRDLVNWTLIARPLNRESLLDMAGVPNSGGVWAPCLSYCNGLFYLVYSITRTFDETTQDTDNYLVTAPDLCGPWSERVYLNSGGFDPSLYHDEDGSKWLLTMRWDSRPDHNHFPGILLQEYSPAQKCLIGCSTLIFTGSTMGLTEGPHLYKQGGFYYLMTAEGGTSQGHAVTLCRSAHREGPYEIDPQNPLLTTRFDEAWPIQYAGHASLIHAVDDAWYLFHLGSRKNNYGGYSVLGHETFLQRVEWDKDGWLRLTNGGYLPSTTVEVTAEASGARTSDFYRRYDFSQPVLDLHLASLRIPLDDRLMSLNERAGYLRLKGRESILSHHHQSFVGTQVAQTPFATTVCLDFEPDIYQQMAGLCLFYNTANFYYLQVTWDAHCGKCLQLMIRDSKRTIMLQKPIPLPYGSILLRAEMTNQEIYFLYKAGEALAWQPVKPDGKQSLSTAILSDEYANRCGEQGFTGSFIGLCCQDLTGSGKAADFSCFEISRLEG